MLPAAEEVLALLKRACSRAGAVMEAGALIVEPRDLPEVCRWLRSDRDLALDYLSNLTAVDYPPDRLDVVYHLYSMARKHGPLTLKVRLPRGTPRVASVTPIWRAAEFQEREVYDLYGVVFEGHPDLRRILMWDGFQGHPMRKDYVPENQNTLEETA